MTIPNNANTYLPGVIQIPSSLTITAISLSNPMVVTVSVNPVTEANSYIVGQVVKLNIPVTYGMWQANGKFGQITAVNGNQITLAINSLNFDPFTIPNAGSLGPATIAPSGSRNTQFSNFTDLLPFQSLNNIGN